MAGGTEDKREDFQFAEIFFSTLIQKYMHSMDNICSMHRVMVCVAAVELLYVAKNDDSKDLLKLKW
eukprot:CAMPEP_0172733232 /NCGR_PEP_ID=MMETSP1074-20121228/106582_1 /TAXON_ID=2916 /ORGANISM="Ceratium fusus, Strain PA161109" /LENGTH=65 /DNA_ID=CAMNT_0013561721 /DNA_START=16 /DNA_END=211 /DNA_ORIENTATION=-